MASYTANKGYPQPNVGDDTGQWGTLLNQGLGILDTNMGGIAVVNVAGNATVTATPAQAQNNVHRLTGALTGNISYILPPVGSFYVIDNQTTGAFSVMVRTSAPGSVGVTAPQGSALKVYSDGTNVFPSDRTRSGNLVGLGTVPVGAGMDFWGATPPGGWYLCYGQTMSRTGYAALFATIGTTYGAGDGSTTFNLPDKRARVSIPMDTMGGAAAGLVTTAISGINGAALGGSGGSQYLMAHNHGVNDPGHAHGVSDPGHNHYVNDPGHNHGVSDPGHNHGVNDPGHNHGVSDPGHSHSQVNTPAFEYAVAPGSGFSVAVNPTGSNTGASGTGISINGNGTGIYLSASGTGIGIYAHTTGISLNASGTGIGIYSSGTGISIQSNGSGGSQNMPPGLVCNYIIYAGV